ncbi:MAG: PAS domain-containing protein [Eubacteriales bacterium]
MLSAGNTILYRFGKGATAHANTWCLSILAATSKRSALPHALALYQFVDGNIIALLASDGFCCMTGLERTELIHQMNTNMFAHPDDRELLAKLGYESMTKESTYDVVYRTQLRDLRITGSYMRSESINLEGGAHVAMVVYTDITDTPHHQMQALIETESPKSRFFDEHLNAMAPFPAGRLPASILQQSAAHAPPAAADCI